MLSLKFNPKCMKSKLGHHELDFCNTPILGQQIVP